MSALTRTATLNDGKNTAVTVTLPGNDVASTQTNTLKLSYTNASGTSVEATVNLTGYTPVPGIE